MTTKTAKTSNQQKTKFLPDMDNFKVSLSYEGLTLKTNSEGKSIAELKRKYAR
ncbi:hypothetical protein [Pseudoalteromonas lipolytica]|uniref:Uncharacterized protein n=1 Tax=Pseudoalteromonas lipolytica TaxID=570156 RepID=A0ABU8SVG3_9GAMM